MNNQTSIKAIIFDCGGVFFRNDNMIDLARMLAKKYQADVAELNQLLTTGWADVRLVNTTNDRRFFQTIAEKLNISATQVFEDFLNMPEFFPKTAKILKSLHAQKFQTAMLSNHMATWHQGLLNKYRLTQFFNPIVTSYNTGLAKPDPKIYRELLRQLQTPAENCLFIDDLAKNLSPAEALKIHTIKFTTPENLKVELIKFGIKV
jgi:epoxide hydrolase-like predicted phosphatase